jgi:hypothetical protein
MVNQQYMDSEKKKRKGLFTNAEVGQEVMLFKSTGFVKPVKVKEWTPQYLYVDHPFDCSHELAFHIEHGIAEWGEFYILPITPGVLQKYNDWVYMHKVAKKVKRFENYGFLSQQELQVIDDIVSSKGLIRAGESGELEGLLAELRSLGVSSFPFVEYHSHERADCYKILNPFTQYDEEKHVLCRVDEGFIKALKNAVKIFRKINNPGAAGS